MPTQPSPFFAALFGLFAGLMFISLAGRWLRFFDALLRKPSATTGDSPIPQGRASGFAWLALLNPVFLLCFIGVPVCAYYFISVRRYPGATWFFAGLGAMIVLWMVGAIAIWRRVLKLQKQKAQSTEKR